MALQLSRDWLTRLMGLCCGQGYNQVSELVRITSKDLEEIASLPGHRKKMAVAVKKMREHGMPKLYVHLSIRFNSIY